MAMTPEEKKRLLVLLTLMSQGSSGRSTLAAIQPILAIIERQKAEEQARKDASRAQRNGIMGQVGNTVGSLGGMYLVGQALAPAAAAPAVASAAPAVAAPNLIGAQMVSTAPVAEASTLGSLGSIALPAAAIIAGLSETWEGGAKDILRGRGNRQDWSNMGLNAITGVAPNLVLRWMGKPSLGRRVVTGKSDAQLNRDDFRGMLKEKGIVDDGYNVTLANGSKFNLGLDGKTKYTNSDGKTTRNAYDVDLNDPLSQYAVSKIAPYIDKMYGAGGGKNGIHPEQYTGMVVNAVISGAKTKEEIDANIAAVLGAKPFEGNAPVRATAATPQQPAAPTPQQPAAPQMSPTPPVQPQGGTVPPQAKPNFMTPPQSQQTPAPAQPAPQATPVPTPTPAPQAPQNPLAAPSGPPVPKSPAPTQNPQQGLLALQQQLGVNPQGGGSFNNIMDLIRALGQRQNGAKS